MLGEGLGLQTSLETLGKVDLGGIYLLYVYCQLLLKTLER